jgi:uncharacterized protein (TIGR02594 family)
MTSLFTRIAKCVVASFVLVLAVPMAQGQARSHHLTSPAVTIATPPHAEVTDFSSRRRNRHVSGHYATRHHSVRHHVARHSYAHRSWRRTARYGAVRHSARRAAVVQQATWSSLGGYSYADAQQQTRRSIYPRGRVAHELRRSEVPRVPASFGLGGGVVAEARRYIGTNPTGRGSLWCATFMNMVLERTGHRGTGSNLAWSFARYGQRVSGPQVGAIAVMGHHVGVVSGLDARGNPIIISGNFRRRVAEAVFPRGRIAAYVMPM